MKIGVFDSGIGGKSVANAIEQALPDAEVIFMEDKDNIPYGNKSPEELYKLALPILNKLSNSGCDIIVVACNTVSTTIIGRLKQQVSTPLVAIVPMVKTASGITKSNVVAVCATPTTLASPRYAELKKEFGEGIEFLEPDCSDWAEMIEQNEVDENRIVGIVNEVIGMKADVIVLGCTHYHWISEVIEGITNGQAVVLQPETAIVEQVKRVLGLPL